MEEILAQLLKSVVSDAVVDALDRVWVIKALDALPPGPCSCSVEFESLVRAMFEAREVDGPSTWDPDRLLTKVQLAEYLQVDVRTLERWAAERGRSGPQGPPYVRFPELRSVRYRVRDVRDWLDI